MKNFDLENSAICAIFVLCYLKYLAAGRWSDFLPKNFILKYFQKLMRFQLPLDQDKLMVKVKEKLIFRTETQWTVFRETLS